MHNMEQEKLTKLDLFTMAAMQGLCAKDIFKIGDLAKEAAEIAEATLAALESRKEVPMSGNQKTDAQLVEKLSATNSGLRWLLNNSNGLLRSAYSIAERSGERTRWEEFRNKVKEELKVQAEFFNKG